MIDHLYIHVPFCHSICAYCDFTHQLYREDIAVRWLQRLKKETELCNKEKYSTIYIGGGTPTSLSDDLFEELLKLISPYINKEKEYEFTIEANPESLSEKKIDLLIKYQVNRISIGLQSCNKDLLKLMNRHHDFNDVRDKVNILRKKGINNISLDIMYSLPSQTMADLNDTLDQVLDLNVEHLSLYSLTVEENTLFGKKGLKSLDEDTEADMYELIEKRLSEKGYIHYEIANFAKAGKESRHNLGYWHYDDFRGLSLGASGKINNHRYDNTKKMSHYLNNEDIIENDYLLSKEDMMFENIMMSLRLEEGLNLLLFNERYDVDFLDYYRDVLIEEKDNLLIENNHLKAVNRELLNNTLLSFMK